MKTTLETSGKVVKNTLETSGEDAKSIVFEEPEESEQLLNPQSRPYSMPSGYSMAGKIHSFRVEKMLPTLVSSGEDGTYTRLEWRRCKLHSFRVEKM